MTHTKCCLADGLVMARYVLNRGHNLHSQYSKMKFPLSSSIQGRETDQYNRCNRAAKFMLYTQMELAAVSCSSGRDGCTLYMW